MNRQLVFRVIAISLVIGFSAKVLTVLWFAHGRDYESIAPEEWSKIETMPYAKALEHLGQATKKMSGWEVVRKHLSTAQGWWIYLKGSLIFFLIALTSATMSLLVKSGGASTTPRT